MPIYKRQRLKSLPLCVEEAQYVAGIFGAEPLLGTEASAAAVMAALEEAQVIHMATHGLLDAGNTTAKQYLQGGIALASQNENGKDGILSATEIAGTRITAKLVVLSCCDTARGRIAVPPSISSIPTKNAENYSYHG